MNLNFLLQHFLFPDVFLPIFLSAASWLYVVFPDAQKKGPRVAVMISPFDFWSVLAVLGCCFLVCSMYQNNRVLFTATWIALSVLLATSFCNEKPPIFQRSQRHIHDLFFSPAVFIAGFLIILIVFFAKIPLSSFNKITLYDDYPVLFAASKRGLEIFRQGALYGFDASVMGGHYTFFSPTPNQAILMLPFALFGEKLGFHIYLLTVYLAYPFLIYFFVFEVTQQRQAARFSFLIACFFLIEQFNHILKWGCFDRLVGIDFFLLSLVLSCRLLNKKRHAAFLLLLSLWLTFYAHLLFFFYACFFLFVEVVVARDRAVVRNLLLIFCALFLTTLNYTFQHMRYPHFFAGDSRLYDSAGFSFWQALGQVPHHFGMILKFQGGFGPNDGIFMDHSYHDGYARQTLVLLPIFLLTMKSASSFIGRAWYYAFFAVLASAIFHPSLKPFLDRMVYVIPPFLCLLLSFYVTSRFGRRILPAAFFLSAAVVAIILGFPRLDAFPYSENLSVVYPDLAKKVRGLEGHMIFLENRSTLNLLREGQSEKIGEPHAHFEYLWAIETNRNYLTADHDGFSFSRYRANTMNSGVFRGRPLREIPVEEMNEHWRRWGVKYLLVWSRTSSEYFGRHPQFYDELWRYQEWHLFRFDNNDLRSVAVEEGEAELVNGGYFRKTIKFRGGVKDSLAVVRFNYFPAWRGRWKGGAVDIFGHKGQMAFFLPTSGTFEVELIYPKYTLLYLFCFAVFMGSFFLFRRLEKSVVRTTGGISVESHG